MTGSPVSAAPGSNAGREFSHPLNAKIKVKQPAGAGARGLPVRPTRRRHVDVRVVRSAKGDAGDLLDRKSDNAINGAVRGVAGDASPVPAGRPNKARGIHRHAVRGPLAFRDPDEDPLIAEVAGIDVVVENVDFTFDGIGQIEASPVRRKTHPV